MDGNLGIEEMEFIELINFTLGPQFVEKWRHKYSEKMIKNFQHKLFESFPKERPLKITVLFNHLTKKCKYSPDYVLSLFDSIDIDMYRPFISGHLSSS